MMTRRKTDRAFNEQTELIKRQADRIEELREENRALNVSLEEYRKKEKEIVDTLEFARKKSDEYVATVRVKYAIECDRLARFREKLRAYRSKEELVKAYDTAYAELKEWQNELENAIAKDFGSPMRDYLEERQRIGDEPALDYEAIIDSGKTDLLKAAKITEKELKDLLDQL